ncbi:MAG: hypothetical protein ACHP7K_09935 [Actinomycetales bacterium]
MTEPRNPAAARLKKPSWKDPRLLVGVLLVLASVASVVALVGGAERTTEVYAARDTIAVGQRITADALSTVRVRLGDAEDSYLPAGTEIPPGTVALRLLPRGELLAKSGIGHADALGRKPAAVSVAEPLPKEVGVGSYVDVWVSMPDTHNGFAAPKKLLSGAEIAELTAASSSLGGSRSTQLQVLVQESELPALLSALANDAKVAVVWNPGAGK